MQTAPKHARFPSTFLDTQNPTDITRALSLLATNGGTVRAGVVAKRLGVSPDVVDRLRLAGRLLAIPQQHGYAYPVCQFDGRSVLAGLPSTLQTLGDVDAWSRVVFLLTPHVELGSRCPLHALRAGAHADVIGVAQGYSMTNDQRPMTNDDRRPTTDRRRASN